MTKLKRGFFQPSFLDRVIDLLVVGCMEVYNNKLIIILLLLQMLNNPRIFKWLKVKLLFLRVEKKKSLSLMDPIECMFMEDSTSQPRKKES